LDLFSSSYLLLLLFAGLGLVAGPVFQQLLGDANLRFRLIATGYLLDADSTNAPSDEG
jgi:hypothetical protein